MLDLVRDGRLDMRAKAGQRVVQPRALDVFGVGADALVKLRGGGERALCQPQGAAILEVDVEGLELLAQLLHRIGGAGGQPRPDRKLCKRTGATARRFHPFDGCKKPSRSRLFSVARQGDTRNWAADAPAPA